jgi:asperthecin polyketide synthase
LLAGAAVAVSTSLADLAFAGAESVRVAFRLGIHVDRVSQSLEPRQPDGSNLDSWAYVVTGLPAENVQREIDQFNAETVCPMPSSSPSILPLNFVAD